MFCPECGEVMSPGPMDLRRIRLDDGSHRRRWRDLLRFWRARPLPPLRALEESRRQKLQKP